MELINPEVTDPQVIWQACQDIAKIDPKLFDRFGEKGEYYEFPQLAPVIEGIRSFYERVTLEDIQMLPGDRVAVFAREAYSAQRAIEDILARKYKPHQIPDVLKLAYLSTRTELTSFVSPDPGVLAGSAGKLKNLTDEAQRVLHDIAQIRDEAKEALSATQQTAGESGVTEYQKVFDDAAEGFKKQRTIGLLALIGVSSAAGILAVLWVSFDPFRPIDEMWTDAIQATAGKLFVFGILSYAVLMVGRVYRSAAHNQIVNEHRRDALKSFRAFVEATSDAATKNAVLVQATHSIFSHRPSGFGHLENDSIPASHMLELTRGVVGEHGETK